MKELGNNKVFQTIQHIGNLIKGTRFENHVYAVGGCVRDIALGYDPTDLDIAVDIEYGGTGFATWLACRCGCHKVNNNPIIYTHSHAAKVNIKNIEEIKDVDIECVSTHKSQDTFGTIEEDAKLRDLTINSIYFSISTREMIDPCNGLDDIANELIRTYSDADKIFKASPIRMLRAIRFATQYGWGIEKNTWLGIVKNAYLIENVPLENITTELNKILLSEKPSRGIRALYNSGMIGYFIPEIKDMIGCTQDIQHFGDVFEHTMKVLDNTQPILINRLSALYHDIGKPQARTTTNGDIHFTCHEDIGATIAYTILKRMKYSNEFAQVVKLIIKNHMRFKGFKDEHIPSNKLLRRFHGTLGEYLDNALDVINADNISHSKLFCMPNQIKLIKEKYEELKKKGETSEKIKLPINGNDIMQALNIKRNPNIGKYLNVVKNAYLENPKITKEECIKLVKETVLVE